MCEPTKYKKRPNARIDRCLRNLIEELNDAGVKTVASCCGHGKYRMTIIAITPAGWHYEIMSRTVINRSRNFYRQDGEGFYYIPECIEYAT